MTFEDRLTGALYGVAIGDGMGAPVEGWNPRRVFEVFGENDLSAFLPITNPERGKGEGRITDDTLMTEALIRAYARAGDHLDAYGYAEYLLPEITETVVFLPEYQREMPIFERLFYPEKYPFWRLRINNAEPRSAGIGNRVNCGVAMYIMPVGAVNAGDPEAAYREAADLGIAHNESFAVEAAAALAAAYAAAFRADSPVESSIEAVLTAAGTLARDGTRLAIEACLQAARPGDDLRGFVERVRAAVAPFDQRAAHAPDDAPLKVEGLSDAGRPSRLMSIEELPVALAALRYGGGDFMKTLRAGVFYGRDCDSIAGMACGLLGALRGMEAIPANLRRASDAANHRDFAAIASGFAQTARSIFAKDAERFAARQRVIAS
jgi:ADP-ribosylglycohydrolase